MNTVTFYYPPLFAYTATRGDEFVQKDANVLQRTYADWGKLTSAICRDNLSGVPVR